MRSGDECNVRSGQSAMSESNKGFTLYLSAAEVATAAAALILGSAESAIAARGRFQCVLAGGRTPLAVYAELARARADWGRWHVFFGDERCLEAADAGRNSLAAAQVWLDQVPIPTDQRYPIPAERGPAVGAADYEALIVGRLPFDLVLLGMGEDGHTASLFPGRAVPAGRLVVPVFAAPKPPPERVSLTPRALAATTTQLILVTGADKAAALAAWRAGAGLPIAEVAALARPSVLVDRDAWASPDGSENPACMG